MNPPTANSAVPGIAPHNYVVSMNPIDNIYTKNTEIVHLGPASKSKLTQVITSDSIGAGKSISLDFSTNPANEIPRALIAKYSISMDFSGQQNLNQICGDIVPFDYSDVPATTNNQHQAYLKMFGLCHKPLMQMMNRITTTINQSSRTDDTEIRYAHMIARNPTEATSHYFNTECQDIDYSTHALGPVSTVLSDGQSRTYEPFANNKPLYNVTFFGGTGADRRRILKFDIIEYIETEFFLGKAESLAESALHSITNLKFNMSFNKNLGTCLRIKKLGFRKVEGAENTPIYRDYINRVDMKISNVTFMIEQREPLAPLAGQPRVSSWNTRCLGTQKLTVRSVQKPPTGKPYIPRDYVVLNNTLEQTFYSDTVPEYMMIMVRDRRAEGSPLINLNHFTKGNRFGIGAISISLNNKMSNLYSMNLTELEEMTAKNGGWVVDRGQFHLPRPSGDAVRDTIVDFTPDQWFQPTSANYILINPTEDLDHNGEITGSMVKFCNWKIDIQLIDYGTQCKGYIDSDSGSTTYTVDEDLYLQNAEVVIIMETRGIVPAATFLGNQNYIFTQPDLADAQESIASGSSTVKTAIPTFTTLPLINGRNAHYFGGSLKSFLKGVGNTIWSGIKSLGKAFMADPTGVVNTAMTVGKMFGAGGEESNRKRVKMS